LQSDDPAFLVVGTEVSAKFKGAFCEAKVKHRTVEDSVGTLMQLEFLRRLSLLSRGNLCQ
uniref:Uncharacterized protein n=1 Tax=Parascaris equorum TaxID=6256 RepID=A0A914R2B7_PAREQ